MLRENRHIIYTTANDSHGDDVRKCEEAKPAINQQVHAHLTVGRLRSNRVMHGLLAAAASVYPLIHKHIQHASQP